VFIIIQLTGFNIYSRKTTFLLMMSVMSLAQELVERGNEAG